MLAGLKLQQAEHYEKFLDHAHNMLEEAMMISYDIRLPGEQNGPGIALQTQSLEALSILAEAAYKFAKVTSRVVPEESDHKDM